MKKIIHIFDLDSTLTVTPTFAEFVGAENGEIINDAEYFSKYFQKIKAAFADELSKEVLFKRSGDYVIPIDSSSKDSFDSNSMEYFSDNKYKRLFEIIQDTMVIQPFPGFHSEPSTIGVFVNPKVKDKYDSVQNKMILTGRSEKLRNEIESNLKEIGVEYPNYGLFMFMNIPSQKKILKAKAEEKDIFVPPYSNMKDYKAWVISKSIEKDGWNTVHFYEDKLDWLSYAEGVIKEKYPDVKFVPHHISNVKDSLSL